MLSPWFAHPVYLLALLALPVCAAFLLFAGFRRRQLTARLAAAPLLRKSVLLSRPVRRWKAACMLLGLALVGMACAGPQWGLDPDAQHRKGRDVILVLDSSRSMNAEQPSRRELALRALRDLADTFEEHGGNRVALVAFASQPRLLFPLTQDYDHLRHVLEQIESNDIARLGEDDAVSGTRIGAALQLAVESYDLHRANRPTIVLLSDGDDPANDGEWQRGVLAAKEKNVKIHTVGIGNPLKDDVILVGRDVLEFEGKPIKTKLQERTLRAIAERTGGEYLPAHTGKMPLGAFVQYLLDADELREEAPADDRLPIYQLRYAWFLLPAALLFMLTLLLNEGPRPARDEPKPVQPAKSAAPRRSRAAALVVMLVALLSVSAADPPAVETHVRQGNEAFARQDYVNALKHYEQAEGVTLDPGLISFNKAAVYFRLGLHKEAIDCYRRCLADDAAPRARRARAHFDLGNALAEYAGRNPYAPADSVVLGLAMVQHSGDDPYSLAEAIAEFRACLKQPKLPAELRADARHNLELAQLRWLKVRDRLAKDKANPDEPTYPEQKEKEKDIVYKEVNPTKKFDRQESDDVPASASKPKQVRSTGTPVTLPDEERLQPLTPDQTLTTLDAHARRIAAARRAMYYPPGSAPPSKKNDW